MAGEAIDRIGVMGVLLLSLRRREEGVGAARGASGVYMEVATEKQRSTVFRTGKVRVSKRQDRWAHIGCFSTDKEAW